MKKIWISFFMCLTVIIILPDVTYANAALGQKIFKKKFRKKCGFSGVRFARNHTSSEWEEIYEKGKFKEEVKKICPRLKFKKIKPTWWEHVNDFAVKYAKDGMVPKC